jgi:hypothetical protein
MHHAASAFGGLHDNLVAIVLGSVAVDLGGDYRAASGMLVFSLKQWNSCRNSAP